MNKGTHQAQTKANLKILQVQRKVKLKRLLIFYSSNLIICIDALVSELMSL